MRIIEVQPKQTVNPYAGDVAKLVEAANTNPLAAGAFSVAETEVGKAKFKIAKAANELDRTAVLVQAGDPDKAGNVELVFQIKPRRKSGPRKPRNAGAEAE